MPSPRALILLTILSAASPALGFQAKRAMTVDDLLAVKSVGDPQVSPDGKLVVYTVSELDRETGKSNSDLWMVPTAGGEPRRLTTAPGADNSPRWAPDGKTIAFVSDRSGSAQVWLLPLDGGEARQLTKLPVDVSGPIWSPKGDRLAFTAEIVPGSTPEETAKKDDEKAKSKSKARIFDRLMIRHWQAWDEGKRSHLFVCDAKTGEAKDLIPGWTANVPPGPFGGSNDYAWSADGQTLAFTSEPLHDHAWSTNSDVWTIPAQGGSPTNITADHLGADAQPSFSPDGKFLAFVRQARAGFEADQWVLHVLPTNDLKAKPVPLTAALDRPVGAYAWAPEGPDLFAIVDDGGYEAIYRVSALARIAPVRLHTGARYTAVVPTRDRTLVAARTSTEKPAEIYRISGDGEPVALTHHNDPLIAGLDLARAENFTFQGADNDPVQGWLVKPPGFDASKKYPVLFLIHGGPQGAWHDEWHARWNYQLFAAPGYVVVAVNPRGSTGFGQKFTDQISQDWTGRVYEDLMKGLDHALATYPYLDKNRMAAAGGSYGGFMVNWVEGHTDRFQALISHAGVFDTPSKYGTTEELWFPEWEFGGVPWKSPENYRKHNPAAFVENFKTPMLITHGALDYRVPEGQGMGLFTALQRQGVPSRLVLFPDEGHWVLKPANRVVWWREMHDWLARYLKEGGSKAQ